MAKKIVSYESRVGQEFGSLFVLALCTERKELPPHRKSYKYLCRCACGLEVTARCADIIRGATKSCGCKKYKTRHGMSYSSEYKIWSGMKARCNNKSLASFVYYGARGIKVCDSWMKSFDTFLSDMGGRPSIRHSLDRINNDGNYEPSNCRWATSHQQSLNKRHPIAPTTELRCYTCGKQILKLSSLAKAKLKHTCSDQCKIRGKYIACKNCGVKFYVIHSLINKTKFCGKECYFNNRYKTKECDIK